MATSDGSILIQTKIDVNQAEKDLAKLKKAIGETESDIADMEKERATAEEKSVFSAQELDAEKAKLEEMKKVLQEIQATAKDTSLSDSVRAEAQAQIPIQKTEISDQQTRVRMLQSEFDKLYNSVERYDEKLRQANKKLERQKEEAGSLIKEINSVSKASLKMAEAQERAEKSLGKFSSRMREVVRSALVFTLISQSLAKFREWMGKVIKTNDEATAAIARLKGALLTMAQPLVDIVIPAFITLVNILTRVISTIAQLFAMLTGRTVDSAKEAAKALNEETEALEGTDAAAEKAAGSLAGFDEINQISTETSGAGGDTEEIIAPDFDFESNLSEDRLKNILALIELIGSSLLTWKISDALGFNMKQTLGLALAIYSAVQFVKNIMDAWVNGVDWSNLFGSLASLAGLAAGLYLAFGSVGAAIGLIVGGLAMIATGFHDAAESGWSLENMLMTIAGIMATGAGIAILAGSWIPLLVAGIASALLAIAVAFGEGENLIKGIKKIVQGFIDFFIGVFTGDIDRAIKGATGIIDGFKTVVNAILNALSKMITSFFDWLDKKSGGRLTVTITLIKNLLTGAVSWVKDTLNGVFDATKQIFSGIIKFFSGVFTGDWDKAWEGLVDIGKGAVNLLITAIESFYNFFVKAINAVIGALNKVSVTIPDWVPVYGGNRFGINIRKIQEVSIPRLATGSVIPPNREFMAVLGDNKTEHEVVSPLSTMKQAFLEAMQESGGMGSGTYTFVVNLDGKELARNQVKHINNMTIAAGKPVLLF